MDPDAQQFVPYEIFQVHRLICAARDDNLRARERIQPSDEMIDQMIDILARRRGACEHRPDDCQHVTHPVLKLSDQHAQSVLAFAQILFAPALFRDVLEQNRDGLVVRIADLKGEEIEYPPVKRLRVLL